MGTINVKYKDRLFCFIFGREENKKWTLDLYNAMNDTSYTSPDDIQIYTIENVLYMGMKNDVAYIVDDVLSVYEQQSTFNPNMPIRELIYVSKLYNKYIKQNGLNIYSENQLYLPVPKLVVFYNGKTEKEDTILTLDDAFLHWNSAVEPDVSVKVKMININYGHNMDLLKKCGILGEYSWLVNEIRVLSKSMDVAEAVDLAIDNMQKNYELKPFLLAHKSEVTDMCITEYNEEETLKAIGEEKYEKGRIEGREEERMVINKLVSLLLNDNRVDDLKRAVSDPEFQKQLLKEYNIDMN